MNEFTMKSKIRDIYKNPVGHDVIDKLLLHFNMSEKILKNPFSMGMSLAALRDLMGKKVDADFWGAVLVLLNISKDTYKSGMQGTERKWWKESVFYQIYPRSFYDSNGDGIGDIPGITAKLDYLMELGADALWLCPVYDSPQDDNGYDIRDYRAIDPVFGTMEDFDILLSEVHKRGMRLIMDMVVNHTSDEHKWFQQAISDPNSKYRDYYFIRKGNDGKPPNNWKSFFSGSAWKQLPGTDDWALCLFTKKQMDLNWDNPDARRDVYEIIRWWLDKGVDGFRLDVITLVSKTPGLPDGNEYISNMMGIRGIEHYFYGPNLHDYLREMQREAFEPYGAFTVGETPGIGIETGKLLTAGYRRELDMIFSFDHLEAPGKSRYDNYIYDAAYLKSYYARWMKNISDDCWMSLFYDNHDNLRMLSKIDPDGIYRDKLAMMLAVIQLTLRGTPFIYQGQELGAANTVFGDISELRDVESLNLYGELIKTMSEEEAQNIAMRGARDHARIPMQWDASEYGGFTSGEPWIKTVSDGYNVMSQSSNADSILNFYKRLIRFRRSHDALIYGEIEVLKTDRDIFAYKRKSGSETLYIECNLSPEQNSRSSIKTDGHLVLSNYAKHGSHKDGSPTDNISVDRKAVDNNALGNNALDSKAVDSKALDNNALDNNVDRSNRKMRGYEACIYIL